jgi:long-chain acyl-CoA synthetase
VIGRSAGGDEDVVAFVELLPGFVLSENDLAGYAAQHLATYKRPSQFVFVPSLPVTPTGKVMKGELTKMMADGVVAR